MMVLFARCVAVLLLVLLPRLAQAEQAVLFVTDWSNSMTKSANDSKQLFELTPTVVDSFFRNMAYTDEKPAVGLITFGDTGKASTDAEWARYEPVCEEDVTLRVTAGTDFDSARVAVMQQLRATRPGGFTPIFSAIEKATGHAVDLIKTGQASSVRIVVITDLEDTCDKENHYRRITDRYCALGQQLFARVEEARREYGGLVKLEFVVAVGANSLNLGEMARCAGAVSLPVTTFGEAVGAGEVIAAAPPPPAGKATLRINPMLAGGSDAFGRSAAGKDVGVLFYPSPIATADRMAADQPIRGPLGTVARFALDPELGVADPPVEVAFDRDRTIDLRWRLPRVTVEVQGATGQPPDLGATVLLRAAGVSNTVFAAVAGEASFSLLPGDYEAIAGFSGGGWEKRAFRVTKTDPATRLLFKAPRPDARAVWTSDMSVSGLMPGRLTMAIDLAPGLSAVLPFDTPQRLAAASASGGVSVELSRDASVVWSEDISGIDGDDWRIRINGGLVWVTARAGPDSRWRLVDRTNPQPVSFNYRGDRFAQALEPGTYMLFLDGEPVCPEGEAFDLRIGRPVDFGTASVWTLGACG